MPFWDKVLGGLVGGLIGGPMGAIAGAVFDDEVKAGVSTIGKYTLAGGGSLVGLGLSGAALVLAGPGVAITVYVAATTVGNLVIRQRKLTEDERQFARSVFADSLDFEKIILTNLTGIGGRAFTLPNVIGQTIINIGDGYEHPTNYIRSASDIPGTLLVHELTHAWQIARSSFKPGFICEGAWQQLKNELGVQVYSPGVNTKPWRDYGIEQQATLIDTWYSTGRVRSGPLFEHVKVVTGGKNPPNYGASWYSWQSLGGKIVGAPGVVAVSGNIMDIYARGANDMLWQKTWVNDHWVEWQQLDGTLKLASSPVVVSMNPQHRDVYAVAQDGSLISKYWTNNQWSGWRNLGGRIKGSPGVVAVEEKIVDIYARGNDDMLWQKTWVRDHWVEWRLLDSTQKISSSPIVISTNPQHRDVYAVAQDGSLISKYWTNNQWSGWRNLGGRIKGRPGVVAIGNEIVDVYARGSDDALWQKTWIRDRWVEWRLLDASLKLGSSPTVTSFHPRHRDVYIRDLNGTLHQKYWT